MNLGEERPECPSQPEALEDRFILSRLATTTSTVREHLEAYNFNLAAEALYDFVWHDFCDWYVEWVKPRLKESPDDGVKGVLYSTLRDIVKLLHPIVPFITEEIWQVLGEQPESVSRAAYPNAGSNDEEAERTMAALQEAVASVRAVRAELDVPAKAEIKVCVKSTDATLLDALRTSSRAIQSLTTSAAWEFGEELQATKGSARKILSFGEIFVPLADLIDVDAEVERLRTERDAVLAALKRVEAKLANEQFLNRAPADVVEKERGKRDEFTQKRERLEDNLASLGG
jgi:valyl-tRNA synthetase